MNTPYTHSRSADKARQSAGQAVCVLCGAIRRWLWSDRPGVAWQTYRQPHVHTHIDTHIHRMHTDTRMDTSEGMVNVHTFTHSRRENTRHRVTKQDSTPSRSHTHECTHVTLMHTAPHTQHSTREREREMEEGWDDARSGRERGRDQANTTRPRETAQRSPINQGRQVGSKGKTSIHPSIHGCRASRECRVRRCQDARDTDRQAGNQLESHFAHRQTMI
mmetsp:Transcript_5976/g.17029  ORF Transcript_5976/g.17029 Transcript_5976/m.17029 type:complete len:219 (+) Transcript_5976:1283-1939(+)